MQREVDTLPPNIQRTRADGMSINSALCGSLANEEKWCIEIQSVVYGAAYSLLASHHWAVSRRATVCLLFVPYSRAAGS